MSARARIHAMFQLGEVATYELDKRLDAHRAEVLAEGAEAIDVKQDEYEAEERERFGHLDHETVLQREAVRDMAALLRQMADEGSVTAPAATATPDFFQRGHTYTREHHGDTIRFLVEYVSTSPDGRYRCAHGWRTRSWDPGWEPTDSDDLTGWTDVTEAGA